jgi:hypothetical protein
MTDNAERAFLDQIDCHFPYDNLDQAIGLIDRGIAISPNAAFGVLHEICRRPRGVPVPHGRPMQLLSYWRTRFNHPAVDMLAEVASAMIDGRDLDVDDVIAKMAILSQYPRLYAALSILYFACDDVDERLEPIDAEIRKRWDALPE